jgi:predicted nicotinamide N-methyase
MGFVDEHTSLARVPFVDEIRIHTAGEVTPIWQETLTALPYWCVPWAGGQALARHVLDHPEIVRGKRVLDFGTGSGLVAIAAALAGASVRAVDIDPFAIEACAANANANNVSIIAECIDLVGQAMDADVILAGDVWYEEEPARRFQAWFEGCGCSVLTGDPGRLYAPRTWREVARYDVPTTLELESRTLTATRILGV